MRADAFEAGPSLESASSLPMSETSTCAGNVQRPAFLDVVVTSDDDDNKNDEEKDYKPFYLRSEMRRTEALLNEFWSEEASRKLRIALIHKDVQLYQQQYKMKRILQSQSIAVESSTSSASSSTSMSSQTQSANKTSKETQTDLQEEEQNVKSSTVNNREDEEDKDTATEMDETTEEVSTEETSSVVDESPPTSNADLAIETELNGDKDTKEEEIDNELICDGKQESQAPAKEETKEQCPQGTDEEDQGADQEVQESESKEASTPSIAMDSPDFMSKIAQRFKALDDDEFINETATSPQADVADEPMSKDDAEGQAEGEYDVSIAIGGEDDAEEPNSDNAGDDDTDEAEMNAMSARPATRPRIIKAVNKDKRKKRVTGGGTSTLYATFKPPQLKNNKRQRRRK